MLWSYEQTAELKC